MTPNEIRRGFLCKGVRPLPELDARFWELEHERTGAKLVWLERKEENKTFLIAFQTQPWDDTGVFHILEHSVLCGSERYPVKEPFVELMKSSLNTFLNAMTFPDRTVYPVSSRNHQDLLNLMRVYLDAVFHPLIFQKPEIFRQEGWRWEWGEDGNVRYQGVVYNEMKGAFASPDTLLEARMDQGLFPDTCYRWVSGGDPEHIPELTYQQFTAAHKRLYHPSNAYIFLDGDLDIDQVLEILDSEYLSGFDRAPAPPPVPIQPPVDGGTAAIDYELSSQEELSGRVRLADGFVACTFRDRACVTALQALSDALCGDNCAPLRRRLLESGLARDVRMSLHSGIQQPWVLLEARDIHRERVEEVSSAMRDELEALARSGLDRQRILAALDNLEFQARQRDYGGMPQGLALGMQVLESWLYGGDPAADLSVGDLFADLRQKCDSGYFETLLRRIFLENTHTCRVIMLPSHTIGQERREREVSRLRAARESWSEEETAALKKQQAVLAAWQSAPDSAEDLKKMPALRLDQISSEPEELPLFRRELGGLPVLFHETPTRGITYLDLYFALDDLTQERLTQAALLCDLLTDLDTDRYLMDELQREIRSRFGGLWADVQTYGRYGQPDRCRTFLCVSCSMLDEKAERAVELLAELLLHTRWDDPEKVFACLRQKRARLSQQIAANGSQYAMRRVSACFSASAVVDEHTGGVTYFQWLKDLERDFHERSPALTSALAELAKAVFVRGRLTLGITAGSGASSEIVARGLSERLAEGAAPPPDASGAAPWGVRREGIIIPADVSFAAMGCPFPQTDQGASRAMSRAASLAYLWNAVRVRGGAYGTGMTLQDTGLALFYSFRDPNAARTLECFRRTPDFLERAEGMDLTGLIIGAVAASDPLLTPRMKGKTAMTRYWKGIDHDELCRIRRELLSTGPRDMAALAGALCGAMKDAAVCVLGSQRQIDACAGQIDTVELL